ncbi:SGNH/GDSL hydrolase family protein [Streptomyces collinus]|uniref:hypothetical protein n=1 Tax=Streptomyces collinus TaxID=42684 RepID=UPI0036A5DA31
MGRGVRSAARAQATARSAASSGPRNQSPTDWPTARTPGPACTPQIRNRAPNARIVVLGYPHLYKIGGSCAYGIGDTSRNAINSAADTIDSVISARAGAWGFTFGDVRGAFSNHEICSDDWWLNSTMIALHESYHPNAKGQANAYLPTFSSRA